MSEIEIDGLFNESINIKFQDTNEKFLYSYSHGYYLELTTLTLYPRDNGVFFNADQVDQLIQTLLDIRRNWPSERQE